MMKNREAYEAIINANISNEITEWAEAQKGKMDSRNANRKMSKTQLENVKVKEAILKFLEGKEATLTADIVAEVGYTINKIGSLCQQLEKEGLVVSSNVKVKKVGNRKAYAIVSKVGQSED